ncbi:TRAP transporter substrate-binding protein [Desulforhopalus sp. 52FAK]
MLLQKGIKKIALAAALVTSIFISSSVQAKSVVKYADVSPFRLLGMGTEYVGNYPFLGVLKFYMELPSIKGKHEFKMVTNVYSSPNDCLNAVATGAVQMTYSAPSFLEQFNPNWKITTTPGLFDDFEHFLRTVKTEPWQKMVKELETKQKVKIVKWTANLGSFMLFTSKPINSVEDVKGLKIRYNGAQGYAQALKKFGATPIALPYTEVVSAMQTHMIDGLISEIQASPYYDLPRYSKHLVPITWAISPMAIVVNADWWDGLDDVSKEVFTYAFETPSVYQELDRQEKDMIANWGTMPKGTIREDMNPDENTKWKNMLLEVGADFTKDSPKELIDAVESTRSM